MYCVGSCSIRYLPVRVFSSILLCSFRLISHSVAKNTLDFVDTYLFTCTFDICSFQRSIQIHWTSNIRYWIVSISVFLNMRYWRVVRISWFVITWSELTDWELRYYFCSMIIRILGHWFLYQSLDHGVGAIVCWLLSCLLNFSYFIYLLNPT